MKKYLLPKTGNFYKANLHCHTTVSDGKITPEETKRLYLEKGYSVIAFTDHDVMVCHSELADENFLPLNGYEMEINEDESVKIGRRRCHICLIATDPENTKQVCFHRTKYLPGNTINYLSQINYDESEPDYEREYGSECVNDVIKKAVDSGFFVTYNHPTWSRERYNDYIQYNGMHAMEIYNTQCEVVGYYEYNEKEYDDMLCSGKRIYCTATDDTHRLESCFGGFTMIKADKLEYRAITSALMDGNFYSSQGPEIFDLWFEDGILHVECSDAKSIRLSTGAKRCKRCVAPEGEFVSSADFEVKPEDTYVRLTITDDKGKFAYTNAYFIDGWFE